MTTNNDLASKLKNKSAALLTVNTPVAKIKHPKHFFLSTAPVINNFSNDLLSNKTCTKSMYHLDSALKPLLFNKITTVRRSPASYLLALFDIEWHRSVQNRQFPPR